MAASNEEFADSKRRTSRAKFDGCGAVGHHLGGAPTEFPQALETSGYGFGSG